MSKIQFEDKSFIEIKKSSEPEKVFITIQAKDGINPLKKIFNSVEITIEQLKILLADIL